MPSPAPRVPTYQVLELCSRCHGADVRVADFGKSGRTAKRMRDLELLRDAEASRPGRKHTVFVQITMGNSGHDLAEEAKEEQMRTGRRIDVVNIVPNGISPYIKRKLAECSFVHEMDLSRHVNMAEMRKIAKELTGYDGPEEDILGVERLNLRDGYRAMVRQMASEGLRPTHIVVPAGAGELLVEVAAEAEKIWGESAPKIIGVTVPQNVLVRKENFVTRKLKRSIADKIDCAYSAVKELVMELVRKGRVELKVVNDKQIYSEYNYLNETLGIEAEPSAAAAFAGARSYGFKPTDTVVIVNTGKGLYDQKAVDKFWTSRFRNLAIRIGLVVAGMVAALGLSLGYDMVRDYVQKSRQTERALESERYSNQYLSERDRINSAIRVVSDGLSIQAACRFLGKPKELCDHYLYESDFTKLEIYYLYRLSQMTDNFLIPDRVNMMDSWRKGIFQPGKSFYSYYPECQQNGATPVPDDCFGPITPRLLQRAGFFGSDP